LPGGSDQKLFRRRRCFNGARIFPRSGWTNKPRDGPDKAGRGPAFPKEILPLVGPGGLPEIPLALSQETFFLKNGNGLDGGPFKPDGKRKGPTPVGAIHGAEGPISGAGAPARFGIAGIAVGRRGHPVLARD